MANNDPSDFHSGFMVALHRHLQERAIHDMEQEGSQAAPSRQAPQADGQLTKQLTADVSHVLFITPILSTGPAYVP